MIQSAYDFLPKKLSNISKIGINEKLINAFHSFRNASKYIHFAQSL
jgi:hypothetical protein